MTPQSIATGLAVTLLTGLVGGWIFRERAIGRNWAFAFSSAIGLVLFRASSVEEIFAVLTPTSAIGWLPWICLAIAGVKTISYSTLRLVGAIALGVGISVRLLWGSIYLSKPSLDFVVLGLIVLWAMASGTAIAISRPAAPGRFNASVLGWVILIACSSCVVGLTGSITYAVHLMGSGRVPIQGAATLVILVGLSVAFSETPLVLGLLLIVCALAISIFSQEEVWDSKWSQSVWVAANATLFCVAVFAVIKLLDSQDEKSGYEPYFSGSATDEVPTQRLPATDSPVAPQSEDAPNEELPLDPFSGFLP